MQLKIVVLSGGSKKWCFDRLESDMMIFCEWLMEGVKKNAPEGKRTWFEPTQGRKRKRKPGLRGKSRLEELFVHDLGRAITHKRIIIRLYLERYLTPEIARRTKHSDETCDRYIRTFYTFHFSLSLFCLLRSIK